MLELTYWDEGIKEALIQEREYLKLLAAFLKNQKKDGLIRKLVGP
jgi:hypothetical protein